MRNSSGWSKQWGSGTRTGHRWKVIVPICAHQMATATSDGQTSSAVLPDGKVIGAVCT